MLVILNSKKFIYTTKKAFIDAVVRYPKLKHKFLYMYPFAWDFNFKPIKSLDKKQITIVHLGSVYGTRNFDNLFLAFDNLYRNNSSFEDKFLLINLGLLSCSNKEMYLERLDFKSLPTLTRIEALEFASKCDYLLLLQHADNRSSESIPYKIYDYINLNKPIICLINNPEIESLLDKRENVFTANLNDIESIEKILSKLNFTKKRETLDSEKQNNVIEQVSGEMTLIENFRLIFSSTT